MEKRISITGCKGFVGSWLQKYLGESIGLDIKLGLEFDVCNKAVQKKIADEMDVVVHLAALSGVKECEDDAVYAFRINAESVLNIAKFMSKRKRNKTLYNSIKTGVPFFN